jgi:hypothetical protein
MSKKACRGNFFIFLTMRRLLTCIKHFLQGGFEKPDTAGYGSIKGI